MWLKIEPSPMILIFYHPFPRHLFFQFDRGFVPVAMRSFPIFSGTQFITLTYLFLKTIKSIRLILSNEVPGFIDIIP